MSLRAAAYKYTLLMVDILGIYLCYVGATWLRFGSLRSEEFLPAIFLPLAAGFIFQYNDLYKVNVFLDRSASATLIIKSILELSLVYVLGGFLTRFVWVAPSRLAFIYFVGAVTVLLAIYRVLLLPSIFKSLSLLGVRKRRVVIVGAGEYGQQYASALQSKKEFGLEIMGFVDDGVPTGTKVLNGFEILGNTFSLGSLVKRDYCDEVVIALDNIAHSDLLSLIDHAKDTGATVKVVSKLFKTISDVTTTESYTIHPTATVTRGLYSPVTFFYQRTCDIIMGGIGLICLSPFFILAACIIKLTSRGPIFYLHERIGKGGKRFRMFKFRSMYLHDSEDERRKSMMLEFMKGNGGKDGSGKVIDESRVTSFGRLMRKTTFDELPQLINVVKGEMSLVGPRPVLPYEHAAMSAWHHERERVLPGCTGFWQVYGRGSTSFDDMIIMDLYMIENMSPWLYLQLILKTFPVLLFAKGAK